jgi:ferredoxin
MADPTQRAAICSCEDSMPLDGGAIARGCKRTDITRARHLCRTQLDLFRRLAGKDGELVIGCTQEAPLFAEIAAEERLPAHLSFVNLRETAGWSRDAAAAGPKMAALIAAAAVPMPAVVPVTLESRGVTLIYGRDETAIEAGRRLQDRLDITVILDGSRDVAPPRRVEFPIRRGRVRVARGRLGAFELTLDGVAEPRAASRAALAFGAPRDGLVSRADIVLDLTGGAPLFAAHELREGYLRADPDSRADVERALFDAADLVGSFDKPRYVEFRSELCAHQRSRRTGCTRCLDLCPAGAIAPAGDSVAIDTALCAGCGACAAVCPTGAASYALPDAATLLAKLRALLLTYREAGGSDGVVLIHDGGHGEALIDALARFGDGLPANVLPLQVNEVTQLGIEALAAALAYGARAVRLLVRAKPLHDLTGLERTIGLANTLAAALGYGDQACALVACDDPDALAAAFAQATLTKPVREPASFIAAGGKREVMNFALRELHRVAPAPVDVVALSAGAPFGRIDVDIGGCTLCLACVSACPVSALGDDPDKPRLSFDEQLCVQCGLCAATCPEKVIRLEPRIRFSAFNAAPVVVKEEEPFPCIACGKPFGTRSSIERVAARLAGKHWMFAGENAKRLDVIRMCESCRVGAMTQESFDPYGAPERPRPRTSEDYLREREERHKRDEES